RYRSTSLPSLASWPETGPKNRVQFNQYSVSANISSTLTCSSLSAIYFSNSFNLAGRFAFLDFLMVTSPFSIFTCSCFGIDWSVSLATCFNACCVCRRKSWAEEGRWTCLQNSVRFSSYSFHVITCFRQSADLSLPSIYKSPAFSSNVTLEKTQTSK